MNNNNSVAIIVVGLLGFLAIIITGKWLLDKHHDHDRVQQVQVAPQQPGPAPQQPPQQIIVTPPAPPANIIIGQPYPQTYPQFHSKHEFWQGYSDGWNNIPMRQRCPEYVQGYQIGQHDRRCNRPYYHQQHCPPGFTLRTPGFSLNIR
jgi:hypothetical protein